MKNLFKQKFLMFYLIFSSLFITSFNIVLAAGSVPPETNPADLNSKSLLQEAGKTSGYKVDGPDAQLSSIIGSVVQTLLGLLGVIFIILMIYAGYNWLTAAGDSAKVEKAKDTIWRAIIGLIITVGAYAIWNLVSGLL